MSGPALADLGLAGLARAIAAGEVSSVEATRACLDGLDTTGRELLAVARLWPERALEEAEACDRERARGKLRGPLHGVPMAHKDMFYRVGELAELGSAVYAGFRPEVTATVLERLDAAGAIDIGRLNMVEIALGITGHNDHTGTPRNPWHRERVTGGSTSGGAAAVAARLIPATLGSDTGGSIRVPSAFCNLVGLKPTYGRVSRAGCMPLSHSLDHIGPLCRSAEDAALFLSVIAGRDARDPTTSARPVPDFRVALGEDLRGLHIAALVEGLEAEPDADVAAAFETALDVLQGLGARVVRRPAPDFREVNALRRVVMMAEAAALHGPRVAGREREWNPQTLARLLPGFALPATAYLRAAGARAHALGRLVADLFADADLVVLPTAPCTAPPIEDPAVAEDAAFVALANRVGAYVGPFNYTGLPAASVPMGFDRAGLPIGLQVVGRPFAEGTILRAAHVFCAATGFAARTPPA